MKMRRVVLRMCAVLVAYLSVVGVSWADIISVNFSENSTNQGFSGGENIGPLATNSTFWNTTNGQPDLAAGTLNDLIDSSGANTGASLTWSSAGTYYQEDDGTESDEARLSVGYLDDWNSAISVTVSNVPYAAYRVYGLYSSDQSNNGSGTVTAQDMQVNGTWVFGGGTSTSVAAYGSITDNSLANGQNWSLLTTRSAGNYWTFDTSGSTLTIVQSDVSDPGRAALAGLVIQSIPEPSSFGLLAFVVGGFIFRRKR